MKKLQTYTEKELLEMGFNWTLDGDEVYLQRVDDPNDYFNSPFEYAEEVSIGVFIIKQG